ncbi:hypothetical protein HDU98_007962 [Podochytrium sp. JEL0797]|nr:hypothetical protein HDU98_007962 [Podochytrium sp. JEL0797]
MDTTPCLDHTASETGTSDKTEADSFALKYTQSLEERLGIAGRLEEAESRANALVCDVRLLRAEAEALRRIILSAGIAAAVRAMPPASVLSPYVASSTSKASLALLPTGVLGADHAVAKDEYIPKSRAARNRTSTSSSIDTTATLKNMPSPQSATHSPNQSHPTPNATTSHTSSTSRKSSVVTSYSPQDPSSPPLPPNSLAWTDIIRTRYPNFQRSTVQTSKHAREFIETRKISFYRVTPTHSLGRSKPTYAIPPAFQKEFLEYFEDKFGVAGVLGKRRVGGDVWTGQPGFDYAVSGYPGEEEEEVVEVDGGAAASGTVIPPVLEPIPACAVNTVAVAPPAPIETLPALLALPVVEAVTVTPAAPLAATPAPEPDNTKNVSATPAASATSTGKRKSISGGGSASSKKKAKEEDPEANHAGGDAITNSVSKKSGVKVVKVVVSKGGLVLTRYNAIVNKMMPDFKTLSNEARLAIKRGVKQFLQHEMGDLFEECLMHTNPAPAAAAAGGETGHVPKPTYGVPEYLVPDFQQWVFVELKKCFPELVVLAPPAVVV